MAAATGANGVSIEKRRQRALVLLEEARQLGALPQSSFDGREKGSSGGFRRQTTADAEPTGDFPTSGGLKRSKSMVLPRATTGLDTMSNRRKREEKDREREHRNNSRRSVQIHHDTLPPIGSPTRNKRASVANSRDLSFYESPAGREANRRGLLSESQSTASLSGSGLLRHGHSHGEEDYPTEPQPEADAWLSGVLASVPGSKRKSALLAPLGPGGEAGETPSAQPEGAPPLMQVNGTAEEQDKKTDGAELQETRKVDPSITIDPNSTPDPTEVIKRYTEGFSAADIARMRSTFNRFKVPDTVDVHKDDLPVIMKRLGYQMVEEEKLRQIADDVTIYSTLDFNEFVTLAERFNKYETNMFQAMFDTFDEDNSGKLSVDEVEKLMNSLGFTPLRKMIREALDVVDKDKSGELNFEEFTHMLAIYRSTEGFTRDEVDEFRKIFIKECGEEEETSAAAKLPAKKLADVLLHFYGPNSLDHCKKLGEEVVVGSRKDAEEGEQGPPQDLNVPEALIWSRRLREMEVDNYRKVFDKSDTDGSGFIDIKELQFVVSNLGFTLTRKNIQDLVEEADEDNSGDNLGGKDLHAKDGRLDFDEFVNIMMIFRTTDGFTNAEVVDFKKTFERFDDDGSGEIDCLELSDMMRYMGYLTKLDDVHRLIATVDFNLSGTLDFREFIRLMRLHREHDMQTVKTVFDKMKDEKENAMPGFAIMPALAELGYKDPKLEKTSNTARRGSATEMKYPSESAYVDFDSFVAIVDKQRIVRVAEGRRRAGFSTQEIDKFKRLFATYDADSSGLIDAKEVSALLTDLGYKMGTKEERDNVLVQLDKARSAASSVGVDDVGEEGGAVSFWVLVQLLRVLYNRDDKRVLDREAHAAEQSRFSTGEIEEFREVFMSWWARDKVFEDEAATLVPGASVGGGEEDVGTDVKELSKDGMRRLLRSLGMALSADQRQALEGKILELGTPSGRVDFATFLRLMRWMLDCNFADINKAAAKAAH
mmetsp:Transcript_62619/g.115082  ORF Transcript_62619/g.115082 Transcript_62619/m.115082 type:complete len:992 (-) Transcript_62619:47-3022(-)